MRSREHVLAIEDARSVGEYLRPAPIADHRAGTGATRKAGHGVADGV